MSETIKGLLVPVGGPPVRIELPRDEEGPALEALRRAVGGDVELLGGVLAEELDVWVDGNGLRDGAAPNRAIFATPFMERRGFVSQMDFRTPVKAGDLYTVLHGPLVLLGSDATASVDLPEKLAREFEAYFTDISDAGSGAMAELALARGWMLEVDPDVFEAAAQATARFVEEETDYGDVQEVLAELGLDIDDVVIIDSDRPPTQNANEEGENEL